MSLLNAQFYVYKMPLKERKDLCSILDRDNKWEELGGTYMKYDVLTIQDIRRQIRAGLSPTDELLRLWGQQNHTVLELFVLLSRMQHYQAMKAIRNLVDMKYHRLIDEGERNMIHLFTTLNNADNKRDDRCPGIIINNDNRNENDTTSDNESISNNNVINAANKPTIPKSHPRIMIESSKILNNLSNLEISTDNNESAVTPPQPDNNLGKLSPQPQGRSTTMTNSDMSSLTEYVSTIPQIAYQDLQLATDNWHKNNILGRGGFGTVYKGLWKNTSVAIKRIEQRSDSAESYHTQMEQSLRELRYLNSCRHDNVLSLYGYSIGGDAPCLIYQFMPGGSLEQRLHSKTHSKNPLTWNQRVIIAKGTARGLQYLHTVKEKPLIHGDIKSANILLDPCHEPRIGDFGLAREGPHSDYTHMKISRVHGTLPYLPEEFWRNRNLSTKVDTYSFGVVLFELATGLRAHDKTREYPFLKDHVVIACETPDIIDSLQDRQAGPFEEGAQYCKHIITTGRLCVSRLPSDRPEMTEVLRLLEINFVTSTVIQ